MKLRFILVFLALFTSNVLAEEEEFELHPALGFVLLEGLVAINSAMASEEPEAFGVALALLSPLGASNNVSETTNWAGIGSAFSLGLYNAIELSNEKYSKHDIFIRNVYGWHAFALVTGVTEYLTGEKIASDNVAVIPKHDGLLVSFNYEL